MTFENHTNYNCKVTLDTGEEFLVFADWLHNNKLDQWNGWHCDAGVTRIAIGANLDVYGGRCLNDKLGNIKTGWKLLDRSTICKRATCSPCTDDLMTKKFKGE